MLAKYASSNSLCVYMCYLKCEYSITHSCFTTSEKATHDRKGSDGSMTITCKESRECVIKLSRTGDSYVEIKVYGMTIDSSIKQ